MDVAKVEKWSQNGGNVGSATLSHVTSRTFVSVHRERLGQKRNSEFYALVDSNYLKKSSHPDGNAKK